MHHITDIDLNRLKQLKWQLEMKLEMAICIPENQTVTLTGNMLVAEYEHCVSLLREIISRVEQFTPEQPRP